jgi:hypothetical protein
MEKGLERMDGIKIFETTNETILKNLFGYWIIKYTCEPASYNLPIYHRKRL